MFSIVVGKVVIGNAGEIPVFVHEKREKGANEMLMERRKKKNGEKKEEN